MFRRVGANVWVVAALGGCAPPLAAMSAGQVGCQESEIQISDENVEFGVSRTWIATCRGVRYVCSQVKTGYISSTPTVGSTQATGGTGAPSVSGAMTQVNCSPEQRPERPVAREEPEQPKARAERPAAEPPSGAAGFRFGQTPDEAESACRGASFAFERPDESHARCAGLPQDAGFEASAELTLCSGKICSIMLLAEPDASAAVKVRSFFALAEALGKKYGDAHDRHAKLPADCRDAANLPRCLQDGRVDLEATWRWSGTSISLTLHKLESEPSSNLRITYAQAPTAVHANTDAL